MSAPVSRLAYENCFIVLDRALESERGIIRLFDEYGEAMNFRMLLNKARDYDRRTNREIYDRSDPMHGQTLYAKLTVRNPIYDEEREKWVLRIEKKLVEDMEIEEIPAPEGGKLAVIRADIPIEPEEEGLEETLTDEEIEEIIGLPETRRT